MAYFCKGICKEHKGYGKYAGGNKSCSICKIFIKFDGYFCPCCQYRLRSKPKRSKARKKLAEKTGKTEKRI